MSIQKFTSIILGVFLLQMTPTGIYAAPLSIREGVRAYENEDYARAIAAFRPLAEQGVVKAQYNLGRMYMYGEGVKQDKVEAVKWYRKAAEQDYVRAQAELGFAYDNGLGVKPDAHEAVKWYR